MRLRGKWLLLLSCFLVATVALFGLFGSPEAVAAKRIAITDSHGHAVRVPCSPQRIVSVNSDVTDVMCALGEEKKIVGVADTADFPPVVKGKAKVGKAFTPSAQKILALKPDVVFGTAGS